MVFFYDIIAHKPYNKATKKSNPFGLDFFHILSIYYSIIPSNLAFLAIFSTASSIWSNV